MRVYMRAGRNTGISTGLAGGLIILVALAAVVFWIAVIIGAIIVTAGLWAAAKWAIERSRR